MKNDCWSSILIIHMIILQTEICETQRKKEKNIHENLLLSKDY